MPNPETSSEMSKEELAILTDQEVPAQEPVEEPSEPAEEPSQPEPAPEPIVEQPRTDDGKFAPKVEAEAPKQEVQPKPRKNVPLAELLAEREKRQQFEKDLAEQREQRAKLEGAFQALSQRFAAPTEEPKPAPTVEEAPIEVLRQVQGQLSEFQRQQQEQQITAQFSNHVRGLAEQFKSKTPDYPDALKYASESRRNQLALYGLNPQQINEQLQRDEFELSAAALQANKNPAEVIYETAKQWGYKPKSGTADARAANGAVPAPNGPSLETIARGQQAARSLGNVSGAAPDTLTGIDRLANMTEKEIAELTPEKFREIMGG